MILNSQTKPFLSKLKTLLLASLLYCSLFMIITTFLLNSTKQTYSQKPLLCTMDTNTTHAVLVDRLTKQDNFQDLGGSGHWLHLLERLLPNLNSASSRSLETELDELYIVFREFETVNNLGAFGRLYFAAVVSGGNFKKIHFGYSKDVDALQSSQFISMTSYRDVFVVNSELRKSPNFIESAAFGPIPPCARKIVDIKWNRFSRRLEWFHGNLILIRRFQARVNQICKIATNATSTESPNVDWKLLYANKSDDISMGGAHVQYKIGRWMRNRSIAEDFVAAPIVRNMKANFKRIVIYQRDRSRLLLNVQQVVPLLQLQLNTRVSTSAKVAIPLSASESQRDAVSTEPVALSLSPQPSNWPPLWSVEVITHSPNASPCDVIRRVVDATVLITPHGFQSTLLLFQPLASLLVEIHPFCYFKPEVYGFIQGGMRQNMHIGRSYLSEESSRASSWVGWLLQGLVAAGLDQRTCMDLAACRFLARIQDVTMSAAFVNRTAEYIVSHFL